MNSSPLTLDLLAKQIADITGQSLETTIAALTSIFSTITEELAAGKADKIELPGIGVFVSNPDSLVKVNFIPDASLAQVINEPFAMFEPLELADEKDVAIADGDEVTSEDSQKQEPASVESTVVEEEAAAVEEVVAIPTDAEAKLPETSPISSTDNSTEAASQILPPPIPPIPDETGDGVTEETENEDVEIELEVTVEPDEATTNPETPVSPVLPQPTQPLAVHPHKCYRLGWLALGLVIGLIIGLLAGALIFRDIDRKSGDDAALSEISEPKEKSVRVESVSPTDPVIVSDDTVTETVASHPVMRQDTVTARRYITHMAKQYYGDRIFWVYIYEANKDKLGHPEHTLPGTVVDIPAKESLPVDPSNPDDVRRAKELATEIYQRFQ